MKGEQKWHKNNNRPIIESIGQKWLVLLIWGRDEWSDEKTGKIKFITQFIAHLCYNR